MLGRPASWKPVWKNVTAGSWLIASVCIDRIDADLVGDLCGMREQFAEPHARFAVLCELENRRRGRESRLIRRHAGEPLALRTESGRFSPAQLLQDGLVIEQVQLRRRAVLEQ